MISNGLVNNLDNLAREGIIDFDAAAFLTDTKPRFVGNPGYTQVPMPEMAGIDTSNLAPLSQDELKYKNSGKAKPVSHNPLWKKILFGFISAGLIIAGGCKLFKTKPLHKLFNGIKNGIKNIFTKFKRP